MKAASLTDNPEGLELREFVPLNTIIEKSGKSPNITGSSSSYELSGQSTAWIYFHKAKSVFQDNLVFIDIWFLVNFKTSLCLRKLIPAQGEVGHCLPVCKFIKHLATNYMVDKLCKIYELLKYNTSITKHMRM